MEQPIEESKFDAMLVTTKTLVKASVKGKHFQYLMFFVCVAEKH